MAQLDNWQSNLKTWRERIAFILLKDNLADFKFIVGPEKTIFHAHKLIFAISSPEFENLFYLMQTNMEDVVLPDTSSKIFKIFLNYIYTGKIELTQENVKEIIILGKKYLITLLIKECETFLKNGTSKENVLELLELSNETHFPDLESKCLEIIGESVIEIFQQPEFNNISKQLLEKIVKHEGLACEEIQIFEAVNKWSENYCEKQQEKLTNDNKRRAVGDLILSIKFHSMSLEEFTKCYEGNTPLTTVEIVDIYQKLIKTTTPLKNTFRSEHPLRRCLRFVAGPSPIHSMSLGGQSTANITVNKNIYLFGYGMYGRKPVALEKYRTATVEIKLYNENDDLLAENSEVITFDGTPKIYEILFKSPIYLETLKPYTVYLHTEGPNIGGENFMGENGKTEIINNGVTFTITRSNHETWSYDISTEGVIASFIFSN